MKKLVMAFLFCLIAQACAKPPEADLLPAPLNEARFGKDQAALKRLRPVGELGECAAPYGGSGYTCMAEGPVAGFESATYRFHDDKLEAVHLSKAAAAWTDASFENMLGLIPGRELLGQPAVTVDEHGDAVHVHVRWRHEGYEVYLYALLLDATVVAGKLGTAGSSGPMAFAILTLSGPGVEPEAMPGSASDLDGARTRLGTLARKASRRLALLSKTRAGEGDFVCPFVVEDHGLDDDFSLKTFIPACARLETTMTVGSLTPEGKNALTSLLRSRGSTQFSGFMVAKHEDGLYEVSAVGNLGWFQGRSIGWGPKGKHKLLRTTATAFESRGHFSLWVKKVGSQKISTVNGFDEEWEVIEEDKLATLVKKVLDAREGEQKKEAARSALIALLGRGVDLQ